MRHLYGHLFGNFCYSAAMSHCIWTLGIIEINACFIINQNGLDYLWWDTGVFTKHPYLILYFFWGASLHFRSGYCLTNICVTVTKMRGVKDLNLLFKDNTVLFASHTLWIIKMFQMSHFGQKSTVIQWSILWYSKEATYHILQSIWTMAYFSVS